MALETKKNLVGGLAGVPASQLKERKREDDAWKRKLFGYLEGYKKSFESLTSGKKVKGEGLFSKLFGGLKGLFGGGIRGLMGKILGMIGLGGIFAKVAGLGLGAAMLPAAIIIWGITAAFNVIQDWIKGYKEGGLTGAIATALGGDKDGGIWNSVVQASKWGGIGALAGLATFGPVGALVGGLLGIALGAVFGWLGSEKIATWITDVTAEMNKAWVKIKAMFGVPTLYTDAEYAAFEVEKTALEARLEAIKGKGGLLETIQDEIDTLQAIASRRELTAQEAARYQELLAEERALLAEVQANEARIAKIETIKAQRTQAELDAAAAREQAKFDEFKKEWQGAQLAIDLLEGEMGLLRLAGKLTPEMKANFDAEIAIHKAEQKRIADELAAQGLILKTTADEAHAERQRLATEATGWKGAMLKTGLFFSDLWSGKMFEGMLPDWMTKPLDEVLPNWMTEPIPTFLTWTFPNAVRDLWNGDVGNWLPPWMTKPISELRPEWKDFIPDSLENWYTGMNFEWPDFGALFKKYIYDPGTEDTPMKIFGAEIKFPELNWNADDIWNALPLWIRDPVQFIKDNLPDFGKAAEKTVEVLTEEVLKPATQAAKDVYEFDVMPGQGEFSVKSGTDAVVTGAGKVASGVQSAWNMASDFVTGGDDGAAATAQRSGPSQRTVSRAPPIQKDLHSKVAIHDANMGGVNWAKLGGRDTVEGIILSIWNDLGIKGVPTFTSGIRPKGHPLYRKGSQHSIGAAFDLRSKDIPPALAGEAFSRLKSALGALGLWGQWETGDVNKEGRTGEHFHFQLKRVADAIGNSEPHMKTDLGLMLKAHPSAMGALLRGFGGGGGGTTTVNNVTVAPQTSTSVASTNIAENVYGTVDPYTNAAGAYG